MLKFSSITGSIKPQDSIPPTGLLQEKAIDMNKRKYPVNAISFIFTMAGMIHPSLFFGQVDSSITPQIKSPLVVEEYGIISDDFCSPYNNEFFSKIVSGIYEKRKKWRDTKPAVNPLSSMNEELMRFHYKLVINNKPSRFQPSYNLFHNQKMVLSAVSDIRCFTMNGKKDQFLFVASQPLESGPLYGREILFLNGKDQEWRDEKHGFTCPIFFNDTLMIIDALPAPASDSGYQYIMKSGSKTVYSFFAEGVFNPAVKSFFTYGTDWILEYSNAIITGDGNKLTDIKYEDTVVISGVDIGERNHYSSVFFYHILQGRVFYFYQLDGKIHLYYDGVILENRYDEVVHNLCCAFSAFNPRGNENMVMFYALKDGFWYYVEVGIYG